ncbi:MAG: tRNA (N6-isopentenyl adenosine(37)-C2)-methylthiotransferase MiaB [Eubacteriales bacterium]|jgi:tRNA-2-methylthio-N6-dimethylallyladenosine synthase|nr:tRNA (N6-isopentenyl adenosine(37)-C2)-methylthiotransferase MiaB [Eubacteriales bacterium]
MEQKSPFLSKMINAARVYYIETFGCQMNVRDSETAAGLLETVGFSRGTDKESAALILFNTCCVRDHAEKRVFGNIGALKERKDENPNLIIGVFGCMMQQQEVAEKLYKRFPFVDIVFGTNLLSRLPAFVESAEAGSRTLAVDENNIQIEDDLPSIRTGKINAFVNINYGCDNFCTYCIVPFVRGRERSREMQAVVDEAKKLVAEGYTELTLLGQNVNSYGKDLINASFASLLTEVSKVEGLKRIRFMTSHPKDLSDEMIAAMASLPNVCHHVHLPMQSGSNEILSRMNRKYTRERYLEIVQKLQAAMPDVELTTDIIVGFPGETEEDFLQTLDLVEQVGFASAFTFKYSPRKGTSAATMEEQVTDITKRERLQRLNALQERKSRENNEKYVGLAGIVHVEDCNTKNEPVCYGKFSNFKMVYFTGTPELIGQYVPVTVTNVRKNSLYGKTAESSKYKTDTN